MDTLLKWLAKEAKWRHLWRYILACVGIQIAYCAVISVLAFTFGFNPPETPDGRARLEVMLSPTFVSDISLETLVEELLFRGVPLVCAIAFWEKSSPVLFVAIISSVIFGYLHGGWMNVFAQGELGLLLCGIFLKCGGFGENAFKGIIAAWSAHLLWDLMLAVFCRGTNGL